MFTTKEIQREFFEKTKKITCNDKKHRVLTLSMVKNGLLNSNKVYPTPVPHPDRIIIRYSKALDELKNLI